MKPIKSNRWKPAIAGMAIMTIAATGSMPAVAQAPTPAPTTTPTPAPTTTPTQAPAAAPAPATASLAGQCRAAKQSTAIFSQRSATSAVVAPLAANQRVTLADNGEGGFIGISAPSRGFVQTINLKLCDTAPTPDKGLCRKVVQNQGLVIRQGPNTTANIVGGVDFNGQLFLTTSPATTQTSADGRNWVQIARPVSGWVSNGFKGSNSSNLVFCQ